MKKMLKYQHGRKDLADKPYELISIKSHLLSHDISSKEYPVDLKEAYLSIIMVFLSLLLELLT